MAERLNRTLVERVRAMLCESRLPKFLWGEALNYAVYVKNRTYTRALKDKTPYEVLTGKKPDISNLQVWGQKVWVHDTKGTKLDSRAKEGYWVGIDEESRAHRIYWPEKRSVTAERSIKFIPEDVRGGSVPFEGEYEKFEFEEMEESAEIQEFEGNPEPDVDPDEESNRSNSPQPIEEQPDPLIETEINEPPSNADSESGRGKRVQKPSAYVRRIEGGEGSATGRERDGRMPKGLQPATEMASLVEVEDWAMATVMDSVEYLNPTYEEARKRSDWPKWAQAIKAELTSLEANGTWTLVKRPKDANVVGCKWVLHMKKNSAGEVEKYKARLVARGFTQIYGVDYNETYAPVARLTSFRLILAVANRNKWPVDSFDFDSAYLNSTLAEDEVIYLEQPTGYSKGDPKVWVFRLRKALYGLKQGARSWYETLRKALEAEGFH